MRFSSLLSSCDLRFGTESSLAIVRRRRGAIMALVCILLPVLLILAAFAINVAYLELCRTELYTATDMATRAAGRELTTTQDRSRAILRGQQIAALNTVAGTSLRLAADDFVFGYSQRPQPSSRYLFDTNSQTVNAVQVRAQRSQNSADGPISLFLPSVLGLNSVSIHQEAVSTGVEVDIAIVLDRSGSMAYAVNEVADTQRLPYSAPAGWAFCDSAPPISRWRNLVAAVNVFLDEMRTSPINELVSLSTYGETAVTDVLMTGNYVRVSTAMTRYTNSICANGTNIGGGISEGMNALMHSPGSRPHAVKVIVLMTDGIHNFGTHPIGPAQNAVANGIMVFTITFSDEADVGLMQQVAAATGGKHFHANSPQDLVVAFQEIARGLPSLLTR